MPSISSRGAGSARGFGFGGGSGGYSPTAYIPISFSSVTTNGPNSNTGSVSTFVTPVSGSYEFQLAGGTGGNPNGVSNSGGGGNIILVRMNFLAGVTLYYVAGGCGCPTNSSGNYANGGGGGGGGSFIWYGAASGGSAVLIAAAGGGGGCSITNTSNSLSNCYGKNGNTSSNGLPSWSNNAGYGTNGGDEVNGSYPANTYPALGWNSMIASGNFAGKSGFYGGYGGYGGGGGPADASHAGGGGGGYSAGDGGYYSYNTGFGNADGRNGGGGGGSFANATARYSNLAYSVGSTTQGTTGYVIIRPASA
jgi:hypothetical protein